MMNGKLQPADFFGRTSYARESFAGSGWRPGIRGGLHSTNLTITAASYSGQGDILEYLRKHFEKHPQVSEADFLKDEPEGVELNPRELVSYLCERLLSLPRVAIIESLISHCIDPDAFHVLVTCDRDIRAARKRKDFAKAGKSITFESALRDLVKSDRNIHRHFTEILPGCMWPFKDFDLIVNAGSRNARDIVKEIEHKHAEWSTRVALLQFDGRGKLPLALAAA